MSAIGAAPRSLERTLAQLPDAPGVYLMLGEGERILYIGKAVSLRNRVRSYFQDSAAHAHRTSRMVERVGDVRWIVVNNEIEALILEANLIKRHQPPFNVRLRDDKRYPYLKVTNEPFPRVTFTRVVRDDGGRYFGPYTNAHGLRELINLVRVVFPLRTCREPIDGKRKRPCLQYHIKRCLAPCVGYQSEAEYDALVDEVVLFLEGRQERLLERLHAEMDEAAARLNYEAAARLRDRIVAVRRVTEGQKVVWRSRIDMDLIASARARGQACMQVFLVRGGKLLGQEHFILDGVTDQSDAELYSQFFTQFYTARAGGSGMAGIGDGFSPLALREARDNEVPVALKARARPVTSQAVIPKEVLVEALPGDAGVIEAWLSQLKGQRVRVLRAQRGPRAEYMRLVHDNAEANLKTFLAHQEVQETASAQALSELATALDLPDVPHRIECYDISNIQGTNPVSSMVVFIEGRAKKSDYRRFKIHYDKGANDFAMMQETLRRRLRYLRADTNAPGEEDPASIIGDGVRNGAARLEAQLRKKERFHHRPDLLLIDGGKGQLNAVVEVLEEQDLWGIPVAGLAKEHEWLFVPGNPEPIVLPPGSPGLHLVMRVRDEAHRFAVEYHRKRRGKAMTQSALDALGGIGPVRRKRLLGAFGSVNSLKRASVDEIAAVKGMTPALAAQLKAGLG
ncbi:MAG: excinuclease ABC subunit UvrC [Candidatus Eremiobacteraeota bacterium]|nr:excinuclease ABC subunit UvrC [Candidatus Eremiobacteraeota bacterium]MBC5803993.1 excinuclease ABC subunit UvrC [Candidatus Eremiobacteraeota bacterium]MBC5821932.1 excinuclease ABC subunit UvrC [Candidatus Eremiobacteraeota bacterium]